MYYSHRNTIHISKSILIGTAVVTVSNILNKLCVKDVVLHLNSLVVSSFIATI